jgi:hypothetical protein
MKSLAGIFVISLRIKSGNYRGQNQLVIGAAILLLQRQWRVSELWAGLIRWY